MIAAAVYSICVVLGVGLLLSSSLSAARKTVLCCSVVGFVTVAYLFAGTSSISPFSQGANSFGYFDRSLELSISIVGIVVGIISTVIFFDGTRTNISDYLRPLMLSPVVMIPVVEAIPEAEVSLVSHMLLFCIAFQNGFFWKKVLD